MSPSTAPNEPSDLELVRRCASLEPEPLEILYERHAATCFSLSFRMLGAGSAAEDVVTDAFLRLWRDAPSLDASRGSVRSQLLESVHALAVGVLRASPATRRDGHATTTSLDGGYGLPAELGVVLELAYFGGLTESAIAAQLGVPVDVVKQRARVALDQLAEHRNGGTAPAR